MYGPYYINDKLTASSKIHLHFVVYSVKMKI